MTVIASSAAAAIETEIGIGERNGNGVIGPGST